MEDEHTRDEVREMVTDIMATSTTKLTHPNSFCAFFARHSVSHLKGDDGWIRTKPTLISTNQINIFTKNNETWHKLEGMVHTGSGEVLAYILNERSNAKIKIHKREHANLHLGVVENALDACGKKSANIADQLALILDRSTFFSKVENCGALSARRFNMKRVWASMDELTDDKSAAKDKQFKFSYCLAIQLLSNNFEEILPEKGGSIREKSVGINSNSILNSNSNSNSNNSNSNSNNSINSSNNITNSNDDVVGFECFKITRIGENMTKLALVSNTVAATPGVAASNTARYSLFARNERMFASIQEQFARTASEIDDEMRNVFIKKALRSGSVNKNHQAFINKNFMDVIAPPAGKLIWSKDKDLSNHFCKIYFSSLRLTNMRDWVKGVTTCDQPPAYVLAWLWILDSDCRMKRDCNKVS